MAGKIVADQLEHSTAGSLDTQFVVNGSAKAWVKVIQDSTHTLSDSLNISSIVDGGAGETDCVFTSSMGNALYAAGQCAFVSNNRRITIETASTSQATVQTYQVSTNSSAQDATSGCSIIVMGDLA